MNYLRNVLGMPNLTTNNVIYIAIIILLFAIAIIFMLKDILSKKMSKNGTLSFRLVVISLMLIMIPTIGKEVPIELWLFGAGLGAFIGDIYYKLWNSWNNNSYCL